MTVLNGSNNQGNKSNSSNSGPQEIIVFEIDYNTFEALYFIQKIMEIMDKKFPEVIQQEMAKYSEREFNQGQMQFFGFENHVDIDNARCMQRYFDQMKKEKEANEEKEEKTSKNGDKPNPQQ